MNNHAENNQASKTFSDVYFEWLTTNESMLKVFYAKSAPMETETSPSSTPTLKKPIMDLRCPAHKESPSTQGTGQPTLKGGIALDIDRIIDSLEDVSDSESAGKALDLRLSPVLSLHREEGIMEASAALAPGHLQPSEESHSDGSSSEMDPKMQLPTPSKSLDIEEVCKASILNTPVKRGTESSQSPCPFFEKHPPIWASMPDVPSWELEEPVPFLFKLDDEDEPGNVVQNRSLDNSKAESPIETLSPSKKVVASRPSTQGTGQPTLKGGIALDIDRIIDSLEDVSDSESAGKALDLRLSPVLSLHREEGIMEASAALAPGHLQPSEESHSDGSSSEMDPKMQLPTPSKSLDIEEVCKASILNTPVKRGTESSQSPCPFFEKHPPIWASMPDVPSWELEEPVPFLFKLDDEDEPGNVVQNRSLDNSKAESPIETLSPSKKVVASRNMVFSPRTKAQTPPSQPPPLEVEEEEFMIVDEEVVSPFNFSRTKMRRPGPKELETTSSSEHGGSPGKGSKDSSTEEEGDAREKKPVKTGSSQSSRNTPVKSGSSQSSSKAGSKKYPKRKRTKTTPLWDSKTGSAQSSCDTPVKTGSSQSSRNTPVKAGSKKYRKRKVSSAVEAEKQPTKDSSEEEKTDSSASDSIVCCVLSGKRQRRPPGNWWLSHGLAIGDLSSPTSDRTKQSPSKTPKATKRPSQAAGIVDVEATGQKAGKKKPTAQTGDGTSENGNVAISPKPQRGAPERPLRKTVEEEQASPPSDEEAQASPSSDEEAQASPSSDEEAQASPPSDQEEQASPSSDQEEQASPPSDPSLSEDAATATHSIEQSAMEDAATTTHSIEQSAMEDAATATHSTEQSAMEDAATATHSIELSAMEEEASGNPAVEVSASDASQRPAVIGASWQIPILIRNRLSDEKSQGFVSGPSSLIELDSREEADAFLPSSTVQLRCSATEMCVFPLAPVSPTDRDQDNISVPLVWPAIAYDTFQWFSHRGRILGICTDLAPTVHDSFCAGKLLLGPNMRKPLWVDHIATTVFHVMMGCVALTMDGETSRYSPLQSFRVPCGHAHSLKNPGEETVMLGFTRMLAPETASDNDQ